MPIAQRSHPPYNTPPLQEYREPPNKQVSDGFGDISRGVTDDYLKSDAPGFCQRAVNIILDSSMRPRPHPGTRLLGRGVGNPYPKKFFNGKPIDALFSLNNRFLLGIAEGVIRWWYEAKGIFAHISHASPIHGVGGRAFSQVAQFQFGRNYTAASIDNEIILASGELERPFKVYEDRNGVPGGHFLGLPVPKVSDITVVSTEEVSSDKSYVYAFIFTREYISSGYQKRDLGAPYYLSVKTSGDIGVGGISRKFYIHSDLAGTDFPDINRRRFFGDLRVGVYRTTANDKPFYKVADLDYTFESGAYVEDAVSDNQLIYGARLYTDGGVLENTAPPLTRFVASAGNTLFLASIRRPGVSDHIENRVMHSNVGNTYGFHPSNFIDQDFPITGIRSYKNNVVTFSNHTCERLEGSPAQGMSSYRFENVSGLVATRGLHETANGIYYCSHDGIYLTNGFKAMKISDHITESYSQVSDKSKIVCYYDPKNYRLYFHTFKETEEFSGDAYVLDLLRTGATRNGGCFLRYQEVSGFVVGEHRLKSRAWVSHQNRIYRGNKDSTVSVFVPQTIDREIFLDDDIGESEIVKAPIFFDILSVGLYSQFVGLLKNLTRLTYAFRSTTNGAVQFYWVVDGGSFVQDLAHVVVSHADGLDRKNLPFEQTNAFGTGVLTGSRPLGHVGRISTVGQIGMRNSPVMEHSLFSQMTPVTQGFKTFHVFGLTPVPDEELGTDYYRHYLFIPFALRLFRSGSSYLSSLGTTMPTEKGLLGAEGDPGDLLAEKVLQSCALNRHYPVLGPTRDFNLVRLGFDFFKFVNDYLTIKGLPLYDGNIEGFGQLVRLTSIDFELIDLKVHGEVTGLTGRSSA